MVGLSVPAAGAAITLAVALLSPVSVRAGQDAGPEVWNILPPGQSGTIDAAELARVLATDPANRVAVDGATRRRTSPTSSSVTTR